MRPSRASHFRAGIVVAIWALARAANLVTPGYAPLKRSLLTILTVAAISGWISRGERAASIAAEASDWVRTTDGWEVRQVVEPYEPWAPPPVHPAVIAGLQLGASLFFLVAFPPKVRVLPSATGMLPVGGGYTAKRTYRVA